MLVVRNEMKQAACVLIVKGGHGDQVLLTTRRDSTEVGLPGGKVDPGETPLEAAVREVMEETGVILPPSFLKEVYVEVCEGEVDYKTTCYMVGYDGKIPGGQEEGITSRWGHFNELLTNSPFEEYNKKLLKEVGLVG